MRVVLMLSMLPFAFQCNAHAQVYENSPFYQRTAGAGADTVPRWDTRANGLAVHVRMAFPGYGPLIEGMTVDGPKGHQVIHLYVQDDRYHVLFGYDLLVQPAEGPQVTCVFKPVTLSAWSKSNQLDRALPLAPVPAAQEPLTVHSGDTVAVSMYGDPEHKRRMVQYIQLELPEAVESVVAATGSRP